MTAAERGTPETFRAEDHLVEKAELAGWPVQVTSYRLGQQWQCSIDNVSPGATIARAGGPTREAAVDAARAKAETRLGRQRVFEA